MAETNEAVYVPGLIPDKAITTESPVALSSSMDAVPTDGGAAAWVTKAGDNIATTRMAKIANNFVLNMA